MKTNNFALYREDLPTRGNRKVLENVRFSEGQEAYKIPSASVLDHLCFTGCVFDHTDFSDDVITNTLFDHCIFLGNRWDNAYFENCKFWCCTMLNINMENAKLQNCHVAECDLRHSVFEDVFFLNSWLASCRVTGANVHEGQFAASCFIENVGTFDVSGAQFIWATFKQNTFRDLNLSECNFRQAAFEGENLQTIAFEECILTDASFDQVMAGTQTFERSSSISAATVKNSRFYSEAFPIGTPFTEENYNRCVGAGIEIPTDLTGEVVALPAVNLA